MQAALGIWIRAPWSLPAYCMRGSSLTSTLCRGICVQTIRALVIAWCALLIQVLNSLSTIKFYTKILCCIGICRRTTLRYTASLIGICTAAPAFGLTTWMFALDSLPVNAYFLYLAWKFYRHSDSSSSRKLFRMSLAHLPIVMILMMIHKKREDKEDTLVKAINSLTGAARQS